MTVPLMRLARVTLLLILAASLTAGCGHPPPMPAPELPETEEWPEMERTHESYARPQP